MTTNLTPTTMTTSVIDPQMLSFLPDGFQQCSVIARNGRRCRMRARVGYDVTELAICGTHIRRGRFEPLRWWLR